MPPLANLLGVALAFIAIGMGSLQVIKLMEKASVAGPLNGYTAFMNIKDSKYLRDYMFDMSPLCFHFTGTQTTAPTVTPVNVVEHLAPVSRIPATAGIRLIRLQIPTPDFMYAFSNLTKECAYLIR